MNDKAKIDALRAALKECMFYISDTQKAGVMALEALALTADASEQTLNNNGASECLSVMLWLYRRLPRAYERPPHIEWPISQLAKKLGVDVTQDFAERGAATPAPIAEPSQEVLDMFARIHRSKGFTAENFLKMYECVSPAAPVADTGAVKDTRTDAEVMRGIMKHYDEFMVDTTAQTFGTPFKAWAAAKYPAEYMANRDFFTTPASPSPTADSAPEDCTLCESMGMLDGSGAICPHCDGSGIEPAVLAYPRTITDSAADARDALAQECLEAVARGYTTYNGYDDKVCSDCGAVLGDGEEHLHDCLTTRARAAIASMQPKGE